MESGPSLNPSSAVYLLYDLGYLTSLAPRFLSHRHNSILLPYQWGIRLLFLEVRAYGGQWRSWGQKDKLGPDCKAHYIITLKLSMGIVQWKPLIFLKDLNDIIKSLLWKDNSKCCIGVKFWGCGKYVEKKVMRLGLRLQVGSSARRTLK